MTPTERRQATKALRFLEAYGCGDVKIGQLTGQFPNPSQLPDLSAIELRVLASTMKDTQR